MSNVDDVVKQIDWKLLSDQKFTLIQACETHAGLLGLLNLIDALQDAADMDRTGRIAGRGLRFVNQRNGGSGMSNVDYVVKQIGWELLSEQKLVLIEVCEKHEKLLGLLNLIDALQDAAEKDGYPVVFPSSESRVTSKPAAAPPVRVIVDFSGGLFSRAYATVPIEVMAIDTDDPRNPRAVVPGFCEGMKIWAGVEDARVDAGVVNRAFDGVQWLDDEGPSGE